MAQITHEVDAAGVQRQIVSAGAAGRWLARNWK